MAAGHLVGNKQITTFSNIIHLCIATWNILVIPLGTFIRDDGFNKDNTVSKYAPCPNLAEYNKNNQLDIY